MAKSKSKDAKPTTAQGALSAFKQDLFKVLDNLQVQVNSDVTSEKQALEKFLPMEKKLVAKSKEFGGPSPYFVNPTWTGSNKPNGSKSYEKEFEPIIKRVLSQKTAAQGEHDINVEGLTVNLRNVFKKVFEEENITTGMTTEIGILWVQDSVLECKAYLSVDDQEGLMNQLTKAIFAKKGLPTEGNFDKNNNGYGHWLDAQLDEYLKSIASKGPDIEKMTTQLLSLLQSTLGKYNLSDEDSIRDWVQATITGVPSTIPITNLQKEELIGALEQDITLMFPQPDASFFYSNIQTILLQNIYNPPPSAVLSDKVTGASAPKNLSVIVTVDNVNSTLTADATGGQKPATGYIYKWTNITDKSHPKEVGDKAEADKLSVGVYQVEVSDGINTVTSDPIQLYKSTLALAVQADSQKNVSLNGGDNGSVVVVAKGGKGSYKFSWKNLDDLSTGTGRVAADGKTCTMSGLTAGKYLISVIDKDTKKGVATNSAMADIIVEITQPDYSANNGMKYVIEKILGVDPKGSSNKGKKELASKLEHAMKEVVKIAISKTFGKLPEYGAQGRLISATYDYQMISRVSDYTTALVDELQSDYNTFIPINSSKALSAAQEITSAAVAFREFADSLPKVKATFESESHHTDASGNPKANQAGIAYTKIKNLIENNPNSSLTTLKDLANAVYLSTGKKVPLIKKAEFEGVSLAASTAGLNTSLSKLLTGEESAALESLTQMKLKAKATYEAAYKSFDVNAKKYFEEMDDYIEAKQEFNYDILKVNAVNNALDTLTQVIETGIKHGQFTNVYAKT